MGMESAIITGATGPLGIALADYLVRHDVKVTALVNPGSRRIAFLPQSDLVKIVECDLGALAALQSRCSRRGDTFFHLGWSSTENRASRNDSLQHARNIVHTLEAVQLAHAWGCRAFVAAGSQAELQSAAEDGASGVVEESYGIAKYAAGRLSIQLCQQLGLRHCWARVLSIYGPGERETTALMYCILTLLKGEKPSFTKGEQLWDYLYSADCARALYLIAEKGRHGTVYNVGSGNCRPLREYFEITRDTIDPLLPLGLGEREYPSGQPMRLCADVSTLVEHTGFQPEYPFEKGIRETIEWVRRSTCLSNH